MTTAGKEAIEKECILCTKPFDTTREWQRFCTEDCRVTFHRLIRELNECPNCHMKLVKL